MTNTKCGMQLKSFKLIRQGCKSDLQWNGSLYRHQNNNKFCRSILLYIVLLLHCSSSIEIYGIPVPIFSIDKIAQLLQLTNGRMAVRMWEGCVKNGICLIFLIVSFSIVIFTWNAHSRKSPTFESNEIASA